MTAVNKLNSLSHDERNSDMTRTLFSTLASLSLLALPASAPANDIVDFLRALNGTPTQRAYRTPIHSVGHRYDHDYYRTSRYNNPYQLSRRTSRPVTIGRPGVSFHVSYGNNVLPAPPVPPPVYNHHVLPHQIGEFVTCPVPLERHVVIKDACEIAPNAIPVVIAVRDPHLGRFGSRDCVERIVYVEILVPPCPLQRIRVSPCKTKIRLDYGKYEVDIVSRNGCIEIDYDD